MTPKGPRLRDELKTGAATVFLIGALLLFVFAAVAALDELARLPFYHSLPLAAVLVNTAWLLLLLTNKGWTARLSRVLAYILSATAAFSRRRSASPATEHSTYRTASGGQQRNASQARSKEAIEAALQQIHSVIWILPDRNSFVTRAMRAEGVSDEARS